MNSRAAMLIPMRTAETIVNEIEEMYEEITRRAEDVLRRRTGGYALDLEDWLTAEQELLFKPEVHIEENDRGVTVTICLGKIRPLDVQLVVTPDAMVIQAEDSVACKKVFRTVEFPRRIDVSKAEARYSNGYLILTA